MAYETQQIEAVYYTRDKGMYSSACIVFSFISSLRRMGLMLLKQQK